MTDRQAEEFLYPDYNLNFSTMRFGLDENTITALTNVIAGFAEVDEVVLHGARATSHYESCSDIELSFTGRLDRPTLDRIGMRFDDLYLPYIFRLSLYDEVDEPEAKSEITNAGILFYKNNSHKAA